MCMYMITVYPIVIVDNVGEQNQQIIYILYQFTVLVLESG